ncbi:MarR family transcriptional regulator [Phytomonospora sp. NPDC050363]|uniref:MarR family winged helix-turn-helix transcriptional regulator n=1 Tax=Phytomonospora sp. NPDC050363 TaxID=3155642 RepID=UPI00340E170C
MSRSTQLTELETASREYMASYVLFNQAVADHLGMHPTDVQCLNLITAEPEPVTTGAIAEMTGLTSGSATRLVDRLVKAGYVERVRDTADRRRVLVRVVPEAVDSYGALWARLGPGWREVLEENTAEEKAVLLRHMRRTVELSRRQIAELRGEAPAHEPGRSTTREA